MSRSAIHPPARSPSRSRPSVLLITGFAAGLGVCAAYAAFAPSSSETAAKPGAQTAAAEPCAQQTWPYIERDCLLQKMSPSAVRVLADKPKDAAPETFKATTASAASEPVELITGEATNPKPADMAAPATPAPAATAAPAQPEKAASEEPAPAKTAEVAKKKKQKHARKDQRRKQRHWREHDGDEYYAYRRGPREFYAYRQGPRYAQPFSFFGNAYSGYD